MVSPASNKAQLKFSYKVLTHTTVSISFYHVRIFLTRKINSSTKIILKDDEIDRVESSRYHKTRVFYFQTF